MLVNSVDLNVLIYKHTAGGGTTLSEYQKPPEARISVSPCPFTEKVRIGYKKPGRLSIYNVSGQRILTKMNVKDFVWRAYCYPAGVYIIEMNTGL